MEMKRIYVDSLGHLMTLISLSIGFITKLKCPRLEFSPKIIICESPTNVSREKLRVNELTMTVNVNNLFF